MSTEKVREILYSHERLTVSVENLQNDSDLHQANLTSLATVGLMLALEDEFDLEFPDAVLSKKTFGSIDTIAETIEDFQD